MENRCEKRPFGDLLKDITDEALDIHGAKRSKKTAGNFDKYSSKSLQMMQKMGFKAASGLGKEGQGRRDIIQPTQNVSRQGLGMGSRLHDVAIEFNSADDRINVQQCPDWLYNSGEAVSFDANDLVEWVRFDRKNLSIASETEFCDPKILKDILSRKSVFDSVRSSDMQCARARSNPFESVGKSIFMNRAAVKMANIDSMLYNMFTSPIDQNEIPLVDEYSNEPLYFADVCAGPGGFSEYILWRKNWHAKGFGFTLKGENDFNLRDFLCGHPETFDTHYGEKNDGNVYDPANIKSFSNYVLENTNKNGVHFMMADGGFCVEGQENYQEILSKQLYLCQCAVALNIVRANGHFITKLFDVYTPFSVGLIYLMSKCFEQIAIIKPNSSRPANSERYLVCKWRSADVSTIRDHLFELCVHMFQNANNDLDIHQIVPIELIKSDNEFFEYIVKSNNKIGRKQANALSKLAVYCTDKGMIDSRQEMVQEQSLRCWNVPPNHRREMYSKPIPVPQTFFDLIGSEWYPQRDFLSSRETELIKRDRIPQVFDSVDSWHFVPIEVVESNSINTVRTFFMRGNSEVFQYTDRKTWEAVSRINIELPRQTLIYGEIVKELLGEGKSQRSQSALHIIDGMVLGGEDIRSKPLTKRIQLCDKFARAINRPGKILPNGRVLAPIRCKELISMKNIRDFFNQLQTFKLKDGKLRSGLMTTPETSESRRFYVPRGLLLFNEIKPHLKKRLDPRTNRPFYVDLLNKNSCFLAENLKDPNQIYGSFKSTFISRQLWKWDLITQVQSDIDSKQRSNNIVYRVDLENYIYRH